MTPMTRSGAILPGRARLTVVLLAVVPAVLTYPWRTTSDRWVLGVAAAIALVALAWWRGRHLTDLTASRIRLFARNRIKPSDLPVVVRTATDATTTVLVRVDTGGRELPMDLLAGYLNRYGLCCDRIRVTRHFSANGERTWVGLSISTATNLAALQARGLNIPLSCTAQIMGRRLVEQLRENGCTADVLDHDQLPGPFIADGMEQWRSIACSDGHLAVYRVDAPVTKALAAVSAQSAVESWTVLEMTGQANCPRIVAGAAVRTADRPTLLLPGLTSLPGRQAAALAAIHPLSPTAI